MNLFCGGKFSDRDSEKLLAVSAAGPPAAFFPKGIEVRNSIFFPKNTDF